MCQFKSAILLKDRVYFSNKTESHIEMLEELKIADTQRNAETKFVRVELIPKENDAFSDINSWKFVVDQDILPNWFVKEYDESRMREAVKVWAKSHIFISVDDLQLSNGIFYLKDCKNARFVNSTSKHWGNSTSKHHDNSTSEHWDNSIAYIPEYSSVKYESIVLMENSTLKDSRSKTIYQSGRWNLVLVNKKEG